MDCLIQGGAHDLACSPVLGMSCIRIAAAGRQQAARRGWEIDCNNAYTTPACLPMEWAAPMQGSAQCMQQLMIIDGGGDGTILWRGVPSTSKHVGRRLKWGMQVTDRAQVGLDERAQT